MEPARPSGALGTAAGNASASPATAADRQRDQAQRLIAGVAGNGPFPAGGCVIAREPVLAHQLNQVAFELGQGRERMEDELAARGGRADRLLEAAEPDAALREPATMSTRCRSDRQRRSSFHTTRVLPGTELVQDLLEGGPVAAGAPLAVSVTRGSSRHAPGRRPGGGCWSAVETWAAIPGIRSSRDTLKTLDILEMVYLAERSERNTMAIGLLIARLGLFCCNGSCMDPNRV
jgi:hypothetical protein